jgi:ECF sigma factor
VRWRLIDFDCRTPVRDVPVEEVESPPLNLDVAVDADRLLAELAATHPRWCTVVETKCFSGLTDHEAVEVLGMPLYTLQQMWGDAQKWLRQRMEANATT